MPSPTPYVSIIIPAYNAADYLPETVESVLRQTFTDLELIIVNDGSKDDTLQVARGYEQDQRVTVIDQENQGVSLARNAGFKLSSGPFIAFLDADDVWLPTNLEAKLDKFNQDVELGLVHTDMAVIDEHGNKTGEVKAGKEGHILHDLLLWNGTCIPAPSSILVKREVIEEVGDFDPRLSTGADQDFFFRVAAKYKIGRVHEPLGLYRVHASNMHSNIALMEHDTLLVYQLADERGLFPSKKLRRRAYARMYRILAGSWWKDGNSKLKGLNYIIRSSLKDPSLFAKMIPVKLRTRAI